MAPWSSPPTTPGCTTLPMTRRSTPRTARSEAEITHLDADNNPDGPQGVRVAEVYWPLSAGTPAHQVGVLEVYLPYAPIARDVDAGLGALYRDLAIGLAVLYLLLAAISFSVTRRLRAQVARNAHLAEHDALTGLPNRALFHRRVVEATGRCRARRRWSLSRSSTSTASKRSTTPLATATATRLLRELGRRLGEAVRGDDTVARLGGDEFGVVLTGVQEPDDVADRHCSGCSSCSRKRSRSAGSRWPRTRASASRCHPRTAPTSTPCCSTPTWRCTSRRPARPPWCATTQGHDHYDSGKLALVGELRRAISGDELVLHYQPKACGRHGRDHCGGGARPLEPSRARPALSRCVPADRRADRHHRLADPLGVVHRARSARRMGRPGR